MLRCGLTVVLSAFMILLLPSCFYGDPEKASDLADGDVDLEDGGTVLGPEGGTILSDDGLFSLTLAKDALAKETVVRINILEPSAFPEAGELLLSKVYWVEPALDLQNTARMTLHVPEESLGFVGRYALTLRVAGAEGGFAYVQAEETVQSGDDGSSQTVVEGFGRSVQAVGLFLHEAFLYCNLFVNCSSRGVDGTQVDAAMTTCMNDFGWATPTQNPDAMGASHDAYLCALTRPCADIGCCADASCNTQADGDETDGDADGDDSDGDMDGDSDGDADGDDEEQEEEEENPYLPLTCQPDGDCPDGRVCRAVPGLSDGLGRCVFASPAQDLAGYRHTGTDLQVVEAMTLELDCGTQDPPSPAGPQSFVVRTVLSPFTPLEDLSGITIEARLENNPDTATATATTDAEGHAVLEGLRPNAWFFLVARREGESSQAEVVPTYNYGLWVDGTTASLHTSTSEPLDITYHAVSRIRYQSLSLGTIGEMDGPPEGTGLVMGQVFACNSDEPLSLANATLGFADVQPEILSYFSASASLPQVQLSQRATNNNGLFIAVPVPVGPLGRPFALGRVLNTERVFATTRSNGARVHEGAVSVIRLGRYR